MTREEIINANREELIDTMVECYRTVLECYGNIEYYIYIWEDGEIEKLMKSTGSSEWLKSNDPTRCLYYVTNVKEPYFDPWDCIADPKPEDEDEAKEMEKEVIDDMVWDYITNRVEDAFDAINED